MLKTDSNVSYNSNVSYKELSNDRQIRELWFVLMRQSHKVDITSFGEDVRGNPNALLNEILLECYPSGPRRTAWSASRPGTRSRVSAWAREQIDHDGELRVTIR